MSVGIIIACDGGEDGDFTFSDLHNALSRIEEDFNTRIEISDEDLAAIIPGDKVPSPLGIKLAEKGYLVADIRYPDGHEKGTFIYLKATMIAGLDLKILGYKGANLDFPHQSTIDQFFDETQFEAYRKLGFALAKEMINQEKGRLCTSFSEN